MRTTGQGTQPVPPVARNLATFLKVNHPFDSKLTIGRFVPKRTRLPAGTLLKPSEPSRGVLPKGSWVRPHGICEPPQSRRFSRVDSLQRCCHADRQRRLVVVCAWWHKERTSPFYGFYPIASTLFADDVSWRRSEGTESKPRRSVTSVNPDLVVCGVFGCPISRNKMPRIQASTAGKGQDAAFRSYGRRRNKTSQARVMENLR